MHAVVGRWRMDPARADEQQQFLREVIVPRVRETEGFVSGYWSSPTSAGLAHSFIVFGSAETAAAFAASVRNDPHDRSSAGVLGDELTVAEISVAVS
jgi:hypothetical protein